MLGGWADRQDFLKTTAMLQVGRLELRWWGRGNP